MQQLFPKTVEHQLPGIGATDGQALADKPAVVKFFTPDANWTWYALEAERQPDGDVLFFGLVDGLERELGYFTLSQLHSVRGPMRLPVERDRHYGIEDFREEPFVIEDANDQMTEGDRALYDMTTDDAPFLVE